MAMGLKQVKENRQERIRDFIMRCFSKSKEEHGTPVAWSVKLDAKGGSILDYDKMPVTSTVETKAEEAASQIHSLCQQDVDDREEPTRYEVSITFLAADGTQGSVLAASFSYKPVAESVEGELDAFSGQLKSMRDMHKVLLDGIREQQQQSMQLSSMLMDSLRHREDNITRLVSSITERDSANEQTEVRLERIRAETEKFEKVVGMLAPHVGDVVDAVKGYLPSKASESKQTSEESAMDIKAELDTFAKGLTKKQQAKGIEIFGLETLMLLKEGNVNAFLEKVKEAQMAQFGKLLTDEQRTTLTAILKAVKTQATTPSR